jgi:hypothetical protein
MADNNRDAAIRRAKSKAASNTKQGKGKKGKGNADGGPSIAGHPRAAAQVRRAKGWGGIGGFAIAAYLGYQAAIPPDQIVERALCAGIAGYLLAWACAVTIWRHLVLAELRTMADRARAATPPKPTISTRPAPDVPAPVSEPAS